MSDLNDLDRRLVWIGRSAVLTGGIALAGGLLVYLLSPGSVRANTLLQTGLLLLMATPALRLVTVVCERTHRRDVRFVTLAVVVLLELSVTLWFATIEI